MLLCAVHPYYVALGNEKLAWEQAAAQEGMMAAGTPEEVGKPSFSNSLSHE